MGLIPPGPDGKPVSLLGVIYRATGDSKTAKDITKKPRPSMSDGLTNSAAQEAHPSHLPSGLLCALTPQRTQAVGEGQDLTGRVGYSLLLG